MIDSKLEYGLVNSGTGMLSPDKQQPKKTALRDLQNDNRMVVPKPAGNPPFLKDRGPFVETAMVSGIKRPATECQQSSICNQAPISCGTSGPLVYARRKSEQELLPKSNVGVKDKNTDCAQEDQQDQAAHQQQAQSESTKRSCFSASTPISPTSVTISGGPSFHEKPLNKSSSEPNHDTSMSGVPRTGNSQEPNHDTSMSGIPITGKSQEPNHDTSMSGDPKIGNAQRRNDQHWKERFLRLQANLRSCDHSSHQEYIKMLQSLSSVGRSKHAVELEKRAIQLLLEEGHELMRMKHLNVLGKSMPMNSVSQVTHQFRAER